MIRVKKNNVERIISDDHLEAFLKDGYQKLGNISVEENQEEKKVPLSRMKLEDLKSLAESLGLECDGLNCDELRKVIKDAQEQEGK